MILTRKHEYWKDIPEEVWNDWHWQQSNRITKIEQLKAIAGKDVTADEEYAFNNLKDFMMGITPYYASLIDFSDTKDPLRLQAVPQIGETIKMPDERDDPLAEEHDMPVPGLTHRYPDRVLLYTTHNCPVYCRHCTRKRKVSNPSSAASMAQIELGLRYIREHPQVRDVVISGGDPLSQADHRLKYIMESLQDIAHIDMMRLGTRNLVTLPQRITEDFADMLKELNSRVFENSRRKPIFVNTHYNNPNEVTAEAREACHKVVMAGSPIGNQSVLLKGVNDDPKTMKKLVLDLISMGVRPYYIYLCDPVPSTAHFRTPVEQGLEIIDLIRGHTTGLATPQLVIDAPDGGGKILIPNGIVARHVGKDYTLWKIINFEDKYFYYLAPNDRSDYYNRKNLPVPPDFDLGDLKERYKVF